MSRRANKGGGDDPIMWEVDAGGDDVIGNDPVEISKKDKKKADKSKDLMNKFAGGKSSGTSARDARKEKEMMKREYGDLDSEQEDEDEDVDVGAAARRRGQKDKGFFAGVKWSHIAVLLMMTGGAMVPFVMMAADLLGPHVSQAVNGALPNLQPYLVASGLSSAPRRRLTKFYEKHKPEKMEEVDKILGKYAGEYPLMVRKLESKYNDYGFFLAWEDDEGFKHAQKQTYAYVTKAAKKGYQKYVPFELRGGVKKVSTKVSWAWSKAYKTLDKWTNPDAAKGKSSGRKPSAKSRRARNAQSRED